MAWKKDDWCFFEFNLVQILEVKGEHIQSVSDGSFNTSGYSLEERCVPLTLRHANLSDNAEHWSTRLHQEGNSGLNYPDIHRKLVDLWLGACFDENKTTAEAIGKFATEILNRCRDLNIDEVEGVRLFRQKLA